MSTWHDAYTLRASFRCLKSAEPFRWREVLEECRRSRRFRRWWLKTCRSNPLFQIRAAWKGVAP